MIRRPPISTLFPTRRSSDLCFRPSALPNLPVNTDAFPWSMGRKHWGRSEEHTSELQSHSDLVCRLLLEKKKNVCARRGGGRDRRGTRAEGRGLLCEPERDAG